MQVILDNVYVQSVVPTVQSQHSYVYENASKIVLNAHVEYNLNKGGLPYVCIALFRCLCVPGDGLEPFRQVLLSNGLLPLKRKGKQTGKT